MAGIRYVSGRILVGDHDGVYVLRFEGDVRVTLSGSFDHYMERILVDGSLDSVLVDLTDAIAIDSTSLGVLAKLSIKLQAFAVLVANSCNCPKVSIELQTSAVLWKP